MTKPRAASSGPSLSHLRPVNCWPPCPYDAETRQIQHLPVAADLQQGRRVVDLQQRLRVLGFRPVY